MRYGRSFQEGLVHGVLEVQVGTHSDAARRYFAARTANDAGDDVGFEVRVAQVVERVGETVGRHVARHKVGDPLDPTVENDATRVRAGIPVPPHALDLHERVP